VAYLPDNDAVRLDLSGFASPITTRWFNPRTGQAQAGPKPDRAAEPVSLSRPGGWEDALLVVRGGER
jgi:hypothetical protein